jgi:hypothetical protein
MDLCSVHNSSPAAGVSKPNQTKPNQTKPNQTKPNQTKPNHFGGEFDLVKRVTPQFRKISVFFLLCFFPAFSFAQQAVSLNDGLKEAAFYLAGRLPENSKVAVLRFNSRTQKASDYVLNELSRLLVNDGRLAVVDRRNLELLQEEMNYQLSGEVSDETALSIGKRVGAQAVIFGSMASLGEAYQITFQIVMVETAEVAGLFTKEIKNDKFLNALFSDEEITLRPPGISWLYLGVRGAYSLSFYQGGKDLSPYVTDPDISENPTLGGSVFTAFNLGYFFPRSVARYIGFQTEVTYLVNSFSAANGSGGRETITYSSLMIPLLVKLTFRPSPFMLQAYGGAYLSIPIGKLQVDNSGNSYSAGFSIPGGVTAGGSAGIKLGPGTLFADVRYLWDFGYTVARYNGNKEISHRSEAAFGIGYEIGILGQ